MPKRRLDRTFFETAVGTDGMHHAHSAKPRATTRRRAPVVRFGGPRSPPRPAMLLHGAARRARSAPALQEATPLLERPRSGNMPSERRKGQLDRALRMGLSSIAPKRPKGRGRRRSEERRSSEELSGGTRRSSAVAGGVPGISALGENGRPARLGARRNSAVGCPVCSTSQKDHEVAWNMGPDM